MNNSNRIFGLTNPLARFELLSLPDCVHLDDLGRCALFQDRGCRAKKCSFLCSEGEARESLERWSARMSELDPKEQRRLSERYYGGKRPWLDNGNEED